MFGMLHVVQVHLGTDISISSCCYDPGTFAKTNISFEHGNREGLGFKITTSFLTTFEASLVFKQLLQYKREMWLKLTTCFMNWGKLNMLKVVQL